MDAPSNMVSVKRTAEWDSVITYANKPRTTYKDFRDAKPSRAVIQKAFADYLENCKFANCTVNPGYMKSLGLSK
jgi:endoglucanase